MHFWHPPVWMRIALSLCVFSSLIVSIEAQNNSKLEPNTTTAADAVIVFNEIMYHPLGDDPALEWVELYNQMSINMDISGWRIQGGITFQFPTNTVLPASSYVVISANPERIRNQTGLTNVYGPFTDRISNSGETLRLRNQSGRLMDEMTFSDEDPWPVGADGSGASLSKLEVFSASSPAANWRASVQAGGTPGRINFADNAAQPPETFHLVRQDSRSRWTVPQSGTFDARWSERDFNDSSWQAGTASIGYDTGAAAPMELGNVALRKSVISGSGAYNNNPFDVPDSAGNFVAQNVTDGSVSDEFGVNYWLGRQGQINEHFTLDLEQSYQIEEIRLRNTHNTQHNDRGTASFEIWASQSIDSAKQLLNPVRILRGSLSDVTGLDPLPTDVFTTANGLTVTNARYLRFVALTANNPGGNVGLNEIEVFAPVMTGPDRAYSFNGTLNDTSGFGIHGQNFGTTFSTNIPPHMSSGQSLQFGGVSNQVQIADTFNPGAYTIAMWVNVETVQSSSIILRTDAAGPHSAWSHQLRINGSSRFEHYVFDGTGRSVAATNTIVPGTWTHVALVAKNNESIKIYVNGVQSGGSTSIRNLWTGGNQWRLGSDAGNAGNFFKGKLDDLAIWHTELDAASIQALAAGRSPTQLGGYRRFFSTDVQDSLYQRNSTALLRIPFEVANPASIAELNLNVRYADGFVAFLNGTEVARRNAPVTLEWNSVSLADREDSVVIGLESISLNGHVSRLLAGTNVLAVQALNHSVSEEAFLFSAEVSARPGQFTVVSNVVFREIAAAGSPAFFIDLQNEGGGAVDLTGCLIRSSGGGVYPLPTNTLAAGSVLVVTRGDLNFPILDGDRFFLIGRTGECMDAVEIHNRGRARTKGGTNARWYYTSTETPGPEHDVRIPDAVVINEVMYHHRPNYRTKDAPFLENEEQWVELYNHSSESVDLSGWEFEDAISYIFPAGTTLGPGAYLVIANNATALREKYAGIRIIGNFSGRLSHHSDRIILADRNGNPADEVRYFNSHPWPGFSNGGGSSLELRDPRSDNSVSQAWAASDESNRSAWRRYTYRATAVRPVYSPGIFNFHEFRIGLLNEGEVLVDNVTVTELPAGAPARQLLQNSSFSSGTQAWRLLGNHSHSFVEPRSPGSADSVLRLVATGNTSYLDNRLETTLKVGATIIPVVTGREYEISFDAKWIAGSPQVRTELYYNKVAATTILDLPALSGTPGRRNSAFVQNGGPTYRDLSHYPIIPKATEAITVTVAAEDPDGIGGLNVQYSVNAGAWRSIVMNRNGEGPTYSAQIPAQANGAIIQFYIQGADTLGATSTYPAGGISSRALIKVDSTRLVSGKQTFRTIMTAADSSLLHSAINMMSDDLLGCTVVHNEREVFYDADIRLHGSMFSRNQPNLTGMTIKFPADRLFRGSRESVIVRRRGLVETLVKHLLNSAGGIPGNYDDVVHLVSHRSDNTGSARMNLANYDDTYVESQFEGDDNGTVFKLEGIREYQSTQNGSPEGLKLSQPIGWIQSFDIANLGDDPEQYRWGIMIQSDRRRDDYSRIVAMGKAFSLAGAALKTAADEAIDVDQWARLFALQSLLGIADVYGVENPHNFAFYVRPSDGRVVGLQNDWEFAFGASSSAGINGTKNVYKVLRLPGFQRMYQGHLLDLIESVANSRYATPWAQHFSAVTGESYSGVPSYLSARGNSVRSQLAPRIAFEISTGNGAPVSVDTPTITLQGRGWIDVYNIYRAGDSNPLELTWLDDQRWQATISLSSGTNQVELRAFNYRGVEVGSDGVTVVTAISEFPQRDFLRITELMYHPPMPGTNELSAGFVDPDDFEFVELMNTGASSVSLLGVRFTVGIDFDFSNAAITNLLPGARVLLVRKRAAFELRYGTNLPVAGVFEGSFSNGGETVRLVDQFGGVIEEFTYGDEGAWPEEADGLGRSLERGNISGIAADPVNWRPSFTEGGNPGAGTTIAPQVSVAFAGGQIQIRIELAAGTGCEVLTSDSLHGGAWTRLRLVPAAPGARMETISEIVNAGARFYRVNPL